MIYYFVPEDYDSTDEFNAFGIEKNIEEIKLKDIRKAFPLIGEYHFRFKNLINKSIVWMDLNSDECLALLFQNKIFLKVTRICWGLNEVCKSAIKDVGNFNQGNSFNLFDFSNEDKPEERKQNSFDFLFSN